MMNEAQAAFAVAEPPAGRALLPREVTALRILLLMLALTMTGVLVGYPGTDDLNAYFLPWLHNTQRLGLVEGFAAGHGDYPPGTSLILAAIGRLFPLAQADERLAIKWSLVATLILSSIVVGAWTRSSSWALVFHIALAYPIVALGYLDIYFVPFLIGALWALERHRPSLAGALFASACLIKWQPVLVAPFALIYVWRDDATTRRRAAWSAVPGAGLIAIVSGVYGHPMLDAWNNATHHRFLSGNALNFPWIVTHWLHVFRPQAFGGLIDGQSNFVETRNAAYTTLPRLLFYLTYGVTVIAALIRLRSFRDLLWLSLLGSLAYFTFNTGVHENHLLVTAVIGLILAARERQAWPMALAICAFSDANLFLFYGVDGTGFHYSRLVGGIDAALIIAVLMTAFFPLVMAVALRRLPWPPRPSRG